MPSLAEPVRPATTSSVKQTEGTANDQPAADAALALPIWDLPIRLFHWFLVALIGFSWWSAENDRVEWHLWSGFGVLTLLIFRILWGVFGSSTARFSDFVRGPASIVRYLRDPAAWRGIGHNPLGALSVIALLLLTSLQVALGLIISDEDGVYSGPLVNLVGLDTSETARDLHALLFNVLLALIALHVAAILYYRLFKKKRLVGPMITGRGPATEPMRPARWWVALLCLGTAIAITRWIVAGAPPFGG